MALPIPKYSISKLYLLPYYPTREAYENATGQSCPAWDKTRRPQFWCDPVAAGGTEDFVIYDNVLATDMKSGQPLTGGDGQPYTRRMILPNQIAATVNIPPSATNVEGAGVPEYPCPMRALEANEALFFDIMGLVMVKNTDLYVSPYENTFTRDDRALLQSIAKKLGVS
jgi:hypothetical protein